MYVRRFRRFSTFASSEVWRDRLMEPSQSIFLYENLKKISTEKYQIQGLVKGLELPPDWGWSLHRSNWNSDNILNSWTPNFKVGRSESDQWNGCQPFQPNSWCCQPFQPNSPVVLLKWLPAISLVDFGPSCFEVGRNKKDELNGS